MYNVFVRKNIIKAIDDLQPKVRNKIIEKGFRGRLFINPLKDDKINIRHIVYDLYELKVGIYRFYYFVYHKRVKVIEFCVEGELTPFVDVFSHSKKNEQKHKLSFLKKHYNKYYHKEVSRKKYIQIE